MSQTIEEKRRKRQEYNRKRWKEKKANRIGGDNRRESYDLSSSINLTLGVVRSPSRRRLARASLRLFCETYFKEACYEWNHLRDEYVRCLEKYLLDGGRLNICYPRGSAKTTLAKIALIWAGLYGIKQNMLICCQNKFEAKIFLNSICTMLSSSILVEDFPELLPLQRNVDDHRYSRHVWENVTITSLISSEQMMFPRIPRLGLRGAYINVIGMKGRVRGLQRNIGGKVKRVDLILLDDVQTAGTATNPEHVKSNFDFIYKDLLPLCVGEKYPTVINCCTAIAPQDLTELISNDRTWRTERARAIEEFPSATESTALWEEYVRIWQTKGTEEATEYLNEPETRARAYQGYRYNDTAFNDKEYPDAGAYLMYLYLTSYEAFVTEYQCDPYQISRDEKTRTEVRYGDIKVYDEALLPSSPLKGTAEFYGVDVHADILYAVGISRRQIPRFAQTDINLPESQKSAEPNQEVSNYGVSHDTHTVPPRTGVEMVNQWYISDIRLFPGEQPLTKKRHMRSYDGTLLEAVKEFLISLPAKSVVMIDRGYETDDVVNAAKEVDGLTDDQGGKTIYASKGYTPEANRKSISEVQQKESILHKTEYTISNKEDGEYLVNIEVNAIKNIVSDLFRSEELLLNSRIGSRNAVISQFCSEHPVLEDKGSAGGAVSGAYRRYKWYLKGQGSDNHLWDCLIYAFAAAVHHADLDLKPRRNLSRNIEIVGL